MRVSFAAALAGLATFVVAGSGVAAAPSPRVPGLACAIRLPADVVREADVPWLLAAPDPGAMRVRRAPETLFVEVEAGRPKVARGADGRDWVVLRTPDNVRAYYPAPLAAPWASVSDPAARCAVVRLPSGLFGVGPARP